ncbi:MAG: magnesium transporter [Planctomycetota bacterium]|jgi:magnesium transporter
MVREAGEVSALERLIREGSDDDVRRFFLLLRPPELADFLEQVPEEDRLRVVRLMSAPLAAEVLREVEEVEREEILEDLSGGEIAEVAHEMKSDDAADLIQALPPDKAERTLDRLDADERQEIRELLEYGEETAGGIMQKEVVSVRSGLSVAEAIEAVRKARTEDVGEIHEVFVVDVDGRLAGCVSPADLLHADPATALRDVVEPDPVRVPVTMDQEQIAEIGRENDLATIPVVDQDGVLVGQILHDDIADVIEEEATEDIAKLAGTDPDEVYTDSVWTAVRSRVVWLVPGFIGGLLVMLLMSGAEEEIRRAPIIAAYLIVVVGMAGNVGTQNSALTVRSLALGLVDARAWRVVGRQLVTGLVLGLLYGIALFAIALLKEGGGDAAKWSVILGFAIFLAMSVGALMGALVPLLLERLGADPAVASSPFIQTANDVVGAGILVWTVRLVG